MSRTIKKTQNSNKPANLETRKLKVGVTLFLREGTQSLWENGIYQNCGFLLMLLAQSNHIDRCFIVNGGPGRPEDSKEFLSNSPAPVITMDQAMGELDVIIELSAQINPEWGQQFSSRGGKIVGMRVASDFIIDAERMAYNLDPGMLFSKVPYDEIWTLPAFEKTCASYYQYGFQAPVRVMQHLWSPLLVDKSAQDHGKPFAYKPGRKRWRLAIMEPNICSVKTCHLPMILCDVAHRHNSNVIEDMKVYNALALKEHASFINFARSLDLVKQGLGTFEGRFPIFQTMTELSDAIVSHHWENGQNYLYYEGLHGGFPLIHNSNLLGGCGYAYRDFDPEDGALTLLRAIAEHDQNFDAYRADAKAFLKTLSPDYGPNIASYEKALLQLFSK
jgi:hypothetical protein